MIWTDDTLLSCSESYRNTLHRYVEDQGPELTLLLVDNAEEHDILETALEETKPEFPLGIPVDPPYYLLTSPFRYQAEQYGSRFRPIRASFGVLYASEHEKTALYEFAAWRLSFFLESPLAPPSSSIPALSFSFNARHDCMIDLRKKPFSTEKSFTHKSDYGRCQAFAEKARKLEVGIILYHSVRDPNLGANAALLCWEAIDPYLTTTIGRNIKLIFKDKVVLVIFGPRGETLEIPHHVLLENDG